MLKANENNFLDRYETRMYGGNDQWAIPEEAVKVGEIVGDELVARFASADNGTDGDSLAVRDSAHKVLDAALDVVNYAALPTERRLHILHGVINSLAACGVLGGKPEWVEATDVPTTEPGSTTPA